MCLPTICICDDSQSTVLTLKEGDLDVFIDCPFDGPATPFWRIDDVYYDITQVPSPYVALLKPSGLNIRLVIRELDGTTLQCVVPRMGAEGPFESVITLLTVHNSSDGRFLSALFYSMASRILIRDPSINFSCAQNTNLKVL